MKKYVLVFAIIALSLNSFSQISLFSNMTSESQIPCLTIYQTMGLNEEGDFGLTLFTLINQNWAEAQIGFYKSITENLSWGLSLGLEQNDNPLRAGAFLYAGKNKNSFLSFIEKGVGKENYWYKITASHNVNDDFTLSLRAWRYVGIGPVLDFNIVNTNIVFWFMPAYDFEAKTQNIMLGINYRI